MTIGSDVAASGPYYPDGVATAFAFEFEVASASDLKAVWIGEDGAETLISSASYAVTISETDPGGEVEFAIAPSAPSAGDELWFYLDPAFEQQDRYSDEGPFNQSLLERTADHAVRLAIALKEKVDRAILAPRGGPALLLSSALQRAGYFLAFDAAGALVLASGTGADAALRNDIAAANGLALVGTPAGGTALDVLRGLLRVELFGAAGDGLTDDAPAISDAIAYQQAHGGKVIFSGEKTYLCSTYAEIETASPLTIEGNGATLVGPAGGATRFLRLGASLSMHDLVLDTWGETLVRDRTEGATGSVLLERVTFANGTGSAVALEEQVDFVARYCVVRDKTACAWGMRIGWNDYAGQANWTAKFEHCFFLDLANMAASAGSQCGGAICYGRDSSFDRCLVDGISSNQDAFGIYSKMLRGRIGNCIVRNVDGGVGKDVVGINGKGSEPGSVASPNGYETIIFNNDIENIGASGVRGSGIRIQTSRMKALGNHLSDCGFYFIAIDNSTDDQTDILVSGNTLLGTSTAGEVGIAVVTRGAQINVGRNTIRAIATPFRIAASAGGALDNVIVDGPEIAPASALGATNHFLAYVATSQDITNLRLTNFRVTGTTRYGIYFEPVTTQSRAGLVIEGNDLSTASVSKVQNLPAGATVRNNKGYLTGSKTHDWASLAAGAVQSTTVSVTGAAVGDQVEVRHSLALGGTRIWGEVLAANVVTVYQQNPTAGAVDVASGTLSAEARKAA